MKVKIHNINNYFKYNVNSNSNTVKNEEITKSRNFDVIDIKGVSNKDNKDNKDNNDKDIKLNSIKKSIVSDINKETNADKLNKIKEAIKNKSYVIDSDEIANKLLKK